jgi:molybdopterin molybdotransferase
MITIQEARDIVKKNLPNPHIEKMDLAQAPEKVLAEDVFAREPSPCFTNSAMDGFAVRWEDVKDAAESRPATLQIVGESQAGVPYAAELQAGQAVRISTGGMLCRGADSIIPVEETEVAGKSLRVLKADKLAQHVRYEGEEFKPGDLLLRRGTPLNPPQIALLASQGIHPVPVYAAPGTAVIITGTELASYDADLQPGQIRDSNGIMLRSAIRKSGGEMKFSAQVGDHYDATVNAVQEAAEQADIILFSGGVSVGPHDLVKKAAQECGFETLFWQVKQKPGKPLFFAYRGNKLFFGLPGNPVSAYMCYLYYVQPVLQYLQGKEYAHKTVRGTVAAPIHNKINRPQFFRVSLESVPGQFPLVRPIAKQGSHMLTSLTAADGFIHLEVNASLGQGETIEVIPF